MILGRSVSPSSSPVKYPGLLIPQDSPHLEPLPTANSSFLSSLSLPGTPSVGTPSTSIINSNSSSSSNLSLIASNVSSTGTGTPKKNLKNVVKEKDTVVDNINANSNNNMNSNNSNSKEMKDNISRQDRVIEAVRLRTFASNEVENNFENDSTFTGSKLLKKSVTDDSDTLKKIKEKEAGNVLSTDKKNSQSSNGNKLQTQTPVQGRGQGQKLDLEILKDSTVMKIGGGNVGNLSTSEMNSKINNSDSNSNSINNSDFPLPLPPLHPLLSSSNVSTLPSPSTSLPISLSSTSFDMNNSKNVISSATPPSISPSTISVNHSTPSNSTSNSTVNTTINTSANIAVNTIVNTTLNTAIPSATTSPKMQRSQSYNEVGMTFYCHTIFLNFDFRVYFLFQNY